MNFKKIISIILTLTMMLGIMTSTPVSVFGDNSTIFEGNGFKVTYTVNSSWDKNQTIGITITNTGKETIENWAIKYDASGEISNLWNGKINKKDGTSYIIENAGYNSEIKPNQSVNFGYQLTSEKPAAPQTYSFCMKRVPKTEGYTVVFSETGGYGSDVTGNITITNTTDKPIKAWELTFESDFTINNIWNAKLISSENGKFVIKNTEDTSVIQPNSSVTFGLQCKKTSEIKLNNAALSEVIVGDAADEPTEELALFAYGEYNKELNSIVLMWESSIPKGTFDVLISSDGKDYSSAVQLNDTDTYNYAVDGTSEKIYFKIKETTADNKTAESYPFIMVKTADGYELQLEDTDKDGLPDIYEEELGTDISKPDTDGDGLTDYQEVYLTGTDPLKVDTDGNGINDGDEDTDNDGLSALKERPLGTDPSSADTDNDGSNDGDEVNKYKTDPLKYDTDEDTLSDGDEVKLGLNPLSASTNGVPDNQYTIQQSIPADSEAFSEINTAENPYDMSLDIKAAGNVEGNITVSESGYSNVMKNDAILGVCPELVYSENFQIDSVVLKFKVDDEYISNEGSEYAAVSPEFEGIKRYNIFKYFEDINILLPVKTEFDVANNTLYTDVDSLGTYCVIDMEKWLKGLGIEAESSDVQTASVQSDSQSNNTQNLQAESIEMPYKTTNDLSTANNKVEVNETPVDVVFLLQTEGELEEDFTAQKATILDASKRIFTTYVNARIFIIGYKQNSADYLKSNTGYYYYTNISDIEKSLNKITYAYTEEYCSRGAAADLMLNSENLFKVNSSRFSFQIMNGATNVGENYKSQIEKCKALKINYSMILPDGYEYESEDYTNVMNEAIKATKGMSGIYSQTTAVDIYNHIFENVTATKMKAILATGLESVVLKAPLKKNSNTDTDGDGLSDWDEVDTKSGLITFDADGGIKLPTFAECCAYQKLFYVQQGYERFVGKFSPENNVKYATMPVLPIVSDPMHVDGDLDYYNDNEDKNKLIRDDMLIKDTVIDDTNCLNDNYTPDYSDRSLTDALIVDRGIDNTVKIKKGMKFERELSEIRRVNGFSLTPKENSDYTFTVSNKVYHNLKVYTKNWLGNETLIQSISDATFDKNGNICYHYALEAGKKYSIRVTNMSSSTASYTFTAEQDNWVYAPDGGVQTYEKFVFGDYERNIYIPVHVIESIITEKKSRELGMNVTNFKIKNVYDLEYCINKLEINTSQSDKLRQLVSSEATIVGGILAILPGGIIVTLIGGTVSIVGVATLADIDGEYFDQKDLSINNVQLNLVYYQYRYHNLNNKLDYLVDENRALWKEKYYINRYDGSYRTTIDTKVSSTIIGEYCNWL